MAVVAHLVTHFNGALGKMPGRPTLRRIVTEAQRDSEYSEIRVGENDGESGGKAAGHDLQPSWRHRPTTNPLLQTARLLGSQSVLSLTRFTSLMRPSAAKIMC